MKLVDIIKSDKKALIDDEDFDFVSKYTWRLQWSNQKGKPIYYASATMEYDGFKWYGPGMHRIILGQVEPMVIDHIDGNGLNNQRSNLRICTPLQNSWNKGKRHHGSASKDYKGIFFSKAHNSWGASVRYNQKQISLGSFPSEIEAAIAYDIGASLAYGEYARLNFPENTEYPMELKQKIVSRLNGTFQSFTSQYFGVSYVKTITAAKKWYASIKYQTKGIALGAYLTEHEAAVAYDIAVVYLGGDPRKCNFLEHSLDNVLIQKVHILLDRRMKALNLIPGTGDISMKWRYRRKIVIAPLPEIVLSTILKEAEQLTLQL